MQDTNESVDSTSKVLVSIMMSVSLPNQWKLLKIETLRHQQSILPRNDVERRSSEIRPTCQEHVWNS